MTRDWSSAGYYEVTGERVAFGDDGKPMEGPLLAKRARFQTVSHTAATQFVNDVYKRENIICEIHEISYVGMHHGKRRS